MISRKIVTSISILVFLSTGLYAQTKLDITGSSAIEHKPTQTVVSFAIHLTAATYESAISQLNINTNGLSASLKKQGFQSEEIITQQFNISKNRKYVNGTWKEEGFTANQQLNVVFPIDKDRLVKVLKATTGSGSEPEINIRFTIDDETRSRLQKELIIPAVKDAKMKADLIAETSGYSVIGIESIVYGNGGNMPSPQPMYRMAEAKLSSDNSSFEPMESASITLSDQVQITYQLAAN